ncbi:hypothetical protein ACFZCP_45250 [Streptomyces sp. NPDC007971]|uniref:hypothetical protein n=1 Tax=Streptomyces sp. NPDC007971 TaxID=3364799 RepID=UPI0036ECB0C3
MRWLERLGRAEPRDDSKSFTGHDLSTPWDQLDRAHYNGYALWTYLTTPFLLAMPGFTDIAGGFAAAQ